MEDCDFWQLIYNLVTKSLHFQSVHVKRARIMQKLLPLNAFLKLIIYTLNIDRSQVDVFAQRLLRDYPSIASNCMCKEGTNSVLISSIITDCHDKPLNSLKTIETF